eukprot:comp23253_c0_seq2/m.37998 comp23253_c0_seq2/g.37998  ORF comp23253_c0_seq2/g.37998 comp23253_c0_seq2/m.37998 type:complete len:921 (-) comp23253_c0_seq2:445-3207(-)
MMQRGISLGNEVSSQESSASQHVSTTSLAADVAAVPTDSGADTPSSDKPTSRKMSTAIKSTVLLLPQTAASVLPHLSAQSRKRSASSPVMADNPSGLGNSQPRKRTDPSPSTPLTREVGSSSNPDTLTSVSKPEIELVPPASYPTSGPCVAGGAGATGGTLGQASCGNLSVGGGSNGGTGLQPSQSVSLADAGGVPESVEGDDEKTSTHGKNLRAMKKDYRKQLKDTKVKAKSDPLNDSNQIMQGMLKVRDTLKNWHQRMFVLIPGALKFYKVRGDKQAVWKGTVNLAGCKIMPRPSKKEGFCFKIFHPTGDPIFNTKGVVESLPINADEIILRAADEAIGRQWLQAIETVIARGSVVDMTARDDEDMEMSSGGDEEEVMSDSEPDYDDDTEKTQYVPAVGDDVQLQVGGQTGELEEENKSIIWALLKQVKPGMDLSKVTLPTFILEPRSFLELLADYYFHCDVLSVAANTTNPVQRMIEVVRWYVSGFYKKPKGLKKPYNPILGEVYRCQWRHPDGVRTTYVAEQVSHHPPMSAWYVSNRRHGWSLNGALMPKSRFSGNSAGTILDGRAILHLYTFGEDYLISYPNASVKGIFFGAMVMELVGAVSIECPRTGLVCDMEFKQKPMIGGSYNGLSGKIRYQGTVLYTLQGVWDAFTEITDERSKVTRPLWAANEHTVAKRLPQYVVEPGQMTEKDSQRLWAAVSQAIATNDQAAATAEKSKLESAQRAAYKERQEQNLFYEPQHFATHPISAYNNFFQYRHLNRRKWDSGRDEYEYELDGVIYTKLKDGGRVDGESGPESPVETPRPLTAAELSNPDFMLDGEKQPTKRKTQREKSVDAQNIDTFAPTTESDSVLRGGSRDGLPQMNSSVKAQLQSIMQAVDALRRQPVLDGYTVAGIVVATALLQMLVQYILYIWLLRG